jgi:hypothetical protein
VGVLLVSACGKNDSPTVSGAATTTTTAPAAKPTTTSSGGGGTTTTAAGSGASSTTSTTAKGGTVKFDQVVFYQGFTITLHDGTTDTAARTLTIPIDVENTGTDNGTFIGDNISLTMVDAAHHQRRPEGFVIVLAGSKGKGTVFSVAR